MGGGALEGEEEETQGYYGESPRSLPFVTMSFFTLVSQFVLGEGSDNNRGG